MPGNPNTRPVICHLIESLQYGGAEALVVRLAAGMRDSEFVPIVCCLRTGPLAARLEQEGISVHCLNLQRRSILEGPLFVGFVARLFTGLRHVLRRERVALVHAHLPDVIIWAACVGLATGTPVVGTYHGLGIWPQGRSRLDVRNILRRAFYRLSAVLCKRTVAVSPAVRTMLCHDLGVDERKTVLLLNGIDTARFDSIPINEATRAALGLQDRTIVVCVGRLIGGKGQQFLIRAMTAVLQKHPQAALLIIGDGPERGPLERLVTELRLSDAIRLAGERMDVPELLALSSMFVLPSFSEGISLALIEAMAAGKPVIATAIPGNLAVIVDDQHGVLIPPGDAPAIADAICRLLDDPAGAAAVASRGRERVRRHFDISLSLARTASLYAEVLAERQQAATADGRA